MTTSADAQRSLECVRRFQEGEKAAFDELVRMHQRQAYGFVYSLIGNVEDAADILQEGFLRAYEGLGRFRGESGFKTWFYRILINLTRDMLRRRGRSRKLFSYSLDEEDENGAAKSVPDATWRPDKAAQEHECESVLNGALCELSDRQREAFSLRYFQGLKTEEVAHILGCGVPTAKVHIFRAVRHIGRIMGPYMDGRS
ncbi:RNA polymerase sigma factor RpoE [Candidatus Velamenicoccus archaeovorus]|uniref:RNA polymerase sigma factor RpoE n=1 Tax=Velamenicoccus archaeovorus TaxID=1930593 RepID=A0A410P327_VELA1|nr:sigma-70 family RNA polymerase sigma factor [Candidatus Velamenicoccus archaeovorus]QAT16488.1 RNA polymerase sigma factor RpoE [Candidatus Velamenicoccus archaeovorus]